MCELKVGATVEVKCGDKKEFSQATIQKIQDCSQYTVGMYVQLSNTVVLKLCDWESQILIRGGARQIFIVYITLSYIYF
jgi:hypothetical protein